MTPESASRLLYLAAAVGLGYYFGGWPVALAVFLGLNVLALVLK